MAGTHSHLNGSNFSTMLNAFLPVSSCTQLYKVRKDSRVLHQIPVDIKGLVMDVFMDASACSLFRLDGSLNVSHLLEYGSTVNWRRGDAFASLLCDSVRCPYSASLLVCCWSSFSPNNQHF